MEDEYLYCELKNQIIAAAGPKYSFSMEKVKDFYSKCINSKRSLSNVESLRDIFQLLEKRNLLNFKKVKLLHNLGDLLDNEKIKELVHAYKKLCLEDEYEAITCTVCGIRFPSTQDPLGEHRNSNFNDGNNCDVDIDLCRAMENVALSIGPKWGVLARELGTKEFQIDTCYATYPNDPVKQARMGLEFWRLEEQENANLVRLDRALESRLCKKEGFGVHLRRPIITLIP